MAATKKLKLIKDYSKARKTLGLNQSQFWSAIGVTQSGGSRYENGRNVPKPIAILARLVYIEGVPINAANYR